MRTAGSTISIPTKLLATGVAFAVAVVVCGTAATVMVASDVTTKLNRSAAKRGSPRAGQGAGLASGDFRDTGATATLIDSLLRPLGAPVPANPTDLALINSLSIGNAGHQVWDVPAGLTPPGPIPKGAGRKSAIKFALDNVSPEWLSAAAIDSANSWLPVFRRWARSDRQPALWGYRAGLPGVQDSRDLPRRAFAAWSALFLANEGAGLLALRAGRYEDAMDRARENIAAARNFIEQPMLMDALAGRTQLKRGLQLLALAASRGGDTVTAALALHLDSAANNSDAFAIFTTLRQQQSDPESNAAQEIIANQAVHPGVRIEAMTTIALGGCRNIPELVFGPSDKRRDAMARAANSVNDIERGAELAAQHQRFLEFAMNNATVVPPIPRASILERSALMNAFAWIVPPGVRARAALCMQQGS